MIDPIDRDGEVLARSLDAAYKLRDAPRCVHCQKNPGTLGTVHGLFCLACFHELEADNDGVATNRPYPRRDRVGDSAGADATAVSGGGLRHLGDLPTDHAVPHPGDGDSTAALVERLDAWSHDERLGDGALLRKAAARIVELEKERDAAIASARYAAARIDGLEAMLAKLTR